MNEANTQKYTKKVFIIETAGLDNKSIMILMKLLLIKTL